MVHFVSILMGILLMTLVPGALAQDDPDPLAGTAWQLVALDAAPALETTTVTLVFGRDGSAGGSTGCNSYGGSYTISSADIGFSGLVSTMMACAEAIMQQEQTFLAGLQAAVRYEQQATMLRIITNAGQTLIFAPLPGLVNTQWQLVALDGTPAKGTLTLTFDAQNRLAGLGGCNQFGGRYTANAGAIRLEVISTLMACADETLMAQESAYFAALQAAQSFDLAVRDQLTLVTAQGQVLRFTPLPYLPDTQWQLRMLAGTPISADTTITLAFDAAGQISGRGGCNTYSGSYMTVGEALTVTSIISTEMACAETITQQEQAFFAALGTASRHVIVDGQLLVTVDAQQTLVFDRMFPLVETQWQLETLNAVPALTGTTVTLQLNATGQISGSSGCNSYSGSASISGTNIGFSGLVSTKMACAEALMQQEQAFFAALSAAVDYRISAGRLMIGYGSGQTLVFRPVGA